MAKKLFTSRLLSALLDLGLVAYPCVPAPHVLAFVHFSSPLDLVKEIGAGASGLRRKSLLDQLCNDLLEDRMHEEVGGKYIPVPDLQNLGAMGEIHSHFDEGRIVSV
jgi:hypothetical protein